MSAKQHDVVLDTENIGDDDVEFFFSCVEDKIEKKITYTNEELVEIWENATEPAGLQNDLATQLKYIDFVVEKVVTEFGELRMTEFIKLVEHLETFPDKKSYIDDFEDVGVCPDDQHEVDDYCKILKEENGKYLVYVLRP